VLFYFVWPATAGAEKVVSLRKTLAAREKRVEGVLRASKMKVLRLRTRVPKKISEMSLKMEGRPLTSVERLRSPTPAAAKQMKIVLKGSGVGAIFVSQDAEAMRSVRRGPPALTTTV